MCAVAVIKKLKALESGDRIAVLALASPLDRVTFDQGIEEIKALGFEPVFDQRVFAREGFVAGTARDRAAVLLEAWNDPSISAVIAVRGGVGSAELLPFLDPVALARSGKPFIGSSDLTALLTFLNLECGIVAFHGPMVVTLASREEGYDRGSLLGCVSRSRPLGELAFDGVKSIVAGTVSGPLLGGTISQILASLGTPFAFNPPEGHVLLLDEVNERPYRLKRMITQLAQSGILAKAKAVIFAECPGCDEPDGLKASELMENLFEGFHGPVLFGFPTGHTTGALVTLPLGIKVTVVSGERSRLVFDEAAVE